MLSPLCVVPRTIGVIVSQSFPIINNISPMSSMNNLYHKIRMIKKQQKLAKYKLKCQILLNRTINSHLKLASETLHKILRIYRQKNELLFG